MIHFTCPESVMESWHSSNFLGRVQVNRSASPMPVPRRYVERWVEGIRPPWDGENSRSVIKHRQPVTVSAGPHRS